MSKNIFVFCEQRDGRLQNVSFELLGIARQLADKSGVRIGAMLLGNKVSELASTLIGYGADDVYMVDDERLEYYLTEQYSQAVAHLAHKYSPNVILFGATAIGRDLAPRLSARLKTGLTADCTKLEMDEDGNLFMTRPAFGGNLFATIICPDHRPQMSTVRPGVMKMLDFDGGRQGNIVSESIQWNDSAFAVKVKKEVKESKSVESIEQAKILVSCGRGMSKQEQLNQAKQLAATLGGTVSASRAVVDAGIVEQSRQVGQTGKTVRPNAYLAFGISGAVQHLAGMEESEFIVAVNKDKAAPIFKVAHLGIVGDAAAVITELQKELNNYKK